MRISVTGFVITLVLVVAAAVAGTMIGAAVVEGRRQDTSLHEFMHKELNLTAAQTQKLDGMERAYAMQRRLKETELRAANAALANAIQARHTYSPEVQAAVERFHHAMGELQTETILHVLQMRTVLTPQQASKFDARIADALTEEDH